MKTILMLLSIVTITTSYSYANIGSQEVDTKKSSIHWLGTKLTGEHKGTIQLKQGTFQIDDKQQSGTFVIDMTTIKNDDIDDPKYNEKLVSHLKSEDFFNVAAFPTASFTLTSAKKLKDDLYQFEGNLAIMSTTSKPNSHPVSFQGTLTATKTGSHLVGKVTFNRAKWGITYKSGSIFDPKALGDKLIYDDIELTLDIHSVSQPSKS